MRCYKTFFMILKWRNNTLELEDKLDKDEELSIDIFDDDKSLCVYLTKEQIKILIEHLQNVL